MTRVVALLDSMCGDKPGKAPRAFRINPYNFSGRRLYKFVGPSTDLWVTNSCRELQVHATHHGVPDPKWVAGNLKRLEPFALLLVCGRVAQRAYRESGYSGVGKVLEIDHPAARTWTNLAMDKLTQDIAGMIGGKGVEKQCRKCGSSDNLHVHHKNRNHQDNRPSNREVLCRSCHAQEHWDDPEFRAELVSLKQTEEARAKNKSRTTALWETDDYRTKIVAAKTAPEVLDRLRKAAERQWGSSEMRVIMLNSMRGSKLVVEPLFKFIKERYLVYKRRTAGKPKPWTKDPILLRYRFTNVQREWDAVTQWIRENWREPHKDDPNVWFLMTVARLVNWPDSLYELSSAVFTGGKKSAVIWHPEVFVREMDAVKARGGKCWTGAYMIHADADPSYSSKAYYIAHHVLTPMWENRAEAKHCTDSLARFHQFLMSFRDMGSFMAAQVIADTKYTPLLAKADGWDTWAAPGPGSMRGLNLVMEREITSPWKAEDWLRKVQTLRERLNTKMIKAGMEPLHAQDVQNCLCEYSKYVRGSSRSKYPGGA